MPKTYSIAEARHNLAAIVHEAERQSPVALTRRGEPVAVLQKSSRRPCNMHTPTGAFFNLQICNLQLPLARHYSSASPGTISP
jgi:prevent-host-death family protein